MSVTRDEVLKIAQLAELDVDEKTLPLLAEQMSRILDYVAQIGGVAASPEPSADSSGYTQIVPADSEPQGAVPMVEG